MYSSAPKAPEEPLVLPVVGEVADPNDENVGKTGAADPSSSAARLCKY